MTLLREAHSKPPELSLQQLSAPRLGPPSKPCKLAKMHSNAKHPRNGKYSFTAAPGNSLTFHRVVTNARQQNRLSSIQRLQSFSVTKAPTSIRVMNATKAATKRLKNVVFDT